MRDAAQEAGAIALNHFRAGAQTAARIWYKEGQSPVTEADIAVDTFLKERLSKLLPEAGWLSEETEDDPSRLGKRYIWVVDPIDGTRAFSSGHPDWCVSIALLSGHRPILGLLHAPVLAQTYEAQANGGAFLNGHRLVSPAAQTKEETRLRLSGPKPLMDRFTRSDLQADRLPKIPSLALRIARVADLSLDLGLAGVNSHDWDIAAADLILHEAGGFLTDFRGMAPVYNLNHPVHPELIASPAWLHPRAIRAMRP